MFAPVTDSTQYDFEMLNRELDRVKSMVFRRTDAAFFGPLMCGLAFQWSTEVDTAATDGQTFFWNPDFFTNAPTQYSQPKFNEFVIMHELWHVARLHMIRGGTRCPDYWNFACDVRINNDEADAFKVRGGQGLPWGTFPAWYEPKWDKDNSEPMVEEDIYDRIFKNPPGGGLGPSPWGNGDLIPTQDATTAAVNNVVKAIQSAKMSGQPGSIPGGVESVIDRFLSPVIPWETHLKNWMNDLLEHDFSWSRPNRRYSDMYLPSHIEEDGRLDHLVYFQDVSGSISDGDIVRFNSELKYVWDEMKPKRMTVVQFDTIIQIVDEFREGDNFSKIKIKGRGGTCLVEVRQWIIDHEPTAAVIFTDMGVAPMRPLPVDVPILWVCTNNPRATVPFGKLIHIKT